MPRRKRRAGMASCVVSADLTHGMLTINGIAVYPSKDARDKHYEEKPNSPLTFPAEIWIEEHF